MPSFLLFNVTKGLVKIKITKLRKRLKNGLKAPIESTGSTSYTQRHKQGH